MAELLRFKSKGAQGLYYGMGIDEVELDFTDMDGLISLAGENGRGKTSFLEMLSPFAVFPSRQMKDPKRYNLKNQFRDRDSFKEVVYRIDDKEYTFRVEIPAGTTMSPEGYIYIDGAPIVKGKISEYRKKVVELFGSEKMFYSSIFTCQNGKKLTDLPVGEFKQLLIELLGLEKYTEMWRNIKSALDVCERELDLTGKEIESLSGAIAEIDENEARINQARVAGAAADSNFSEAASTVERIMARITADQEQLKRAERAEWEIQTKSEHMEKVRYTITSHQKGREKLIKDHQDRESKILIEKAFPLQEVLGQEEEIIRASESVRSLEKDLEHWRSEAERAKEKGIGAREKHSEIVAGISHLTEKKNAAWEDKQLKELGLKIAEQEQRWQVLEANVDQQHKHINTIENDAIIDSLTRDLEGYAYVQGLLDKRPDDCVIDTCPFITSALDGQAQVKEKTKLLEQRQQEVAKAVEDEKGKFRAMQEDREAIKEAIDSSRAMREGIVQSIDAHVKMIDGEISRASERAIAELIKRDEAAEKYKAAQAMVDALPSQIAGQLELSGKYQVLIDAKAEMKLLEKAAADRQEAHKREVDSMQKTIDNLNRESGELERELSMLMHEVETANQLRIEIARGEANVTEYRKQMEGARENIVTQNQIIQTCQENLSRLEKTSARVEALKERQGFIRDDIARWTYARVAVSKSGLQAMELADAAPHMTALANNLLHRAYGGELYVDLITIDPDTGAEILDIMVTRSDGQTFPLSAYSGGESVWLLQAFKSAQILINAERSGVQCLTCFADEETGALDKEKAERFIKMYRALMEEGGFKKLAFISHLPECQAMADHVLEFDKGGIRAA